MTQELPVELVQHSVVERLDAKVPSLQWARALAGAGVMREVAVTDDVDAPQHWMRLIAQLCDALRVAEERRAAARKTDTFFFGLPPFWWAIIPVWLVVALGVALLRNTFEDRLMTWGLVLGLGGALGVGVLAWVLLHTVQARARNRREEREAVAACAELGEDLTQGVTALLTRSFVARGPRALIVNTPHLDWIRARVRELGRRSAAETDPERRGTLEAFKTRLTAVESEVAAALDAHLADPPDLWTDRGLCPELVGLDRRWRDLGLPTDHRERARWAALVAT